MTKPIKLTEDDILLGEAGVVPHGLQVKIYINHETGFEKARQLKQQILKNQEKLEKIKKACKDYEKGVTFDYNDVGILAGKIEAILAEK